MQRDRRRRLMTRRRRQATPALRASAATLWLGELGVRLQLTVGRFCGRKSNRLVGTGISLVEMSRRLKGEQDGNDEFGITAIPNRPASPAVSVQLVALVATLLLLTAISVVAIV